VRSTGDLLFGREHDYASTFIFDRAFDHGAHAIEGLKEFARSLAQPGNTRVGSGIALSGRSRQQLSKNGRSSSESDQRLARNQIEGAIMMGIGMALFEETHYEPQTGHPINNNLADYCMAVNADTPEIDVTFLDYPDLVMNEYGARGVGEIGLAGVAAAIASAVYHSSGVRIRRLPVKIEILLAPGPTT
jgi:hypothetical protein